MGLIMVEGNELEILKKEYSELRDKYDLPEFSQLNEDFQIEKISENETDFIIREVRRYMADKFSNYMRFIETLLNPTNVPLFVFSITKSLKSEDRKSLTEIYKKLTKFQIEIIKLDIDYKLEDEIEFIKKADEEWREIKTNFAEIIKNIEKNLDAKTETNNKGYFG